jgi:hypothetical protein
MFPRIQQLADYSYKNEYENNRMQLKEEKEQEKHGNQGKDNNKDHPKRVIPGIFVLGR